MEAIELETIAVISVRWPVKPFEGVFDDPKFKDLTIKFTVNFEHKGYDISENQNLTIIHLKHAFIWAKKEKEFQEWGRKKGGPVIAIYISDAINRLIDLVQGTFEETSNNPYPHIRHVGVSDFVSLDSLCGPRRQNLISYAMPALVAIFANRSEGIVSKVSLIDKGVPTLEKTKILRAVELLNSGYKTESVLIGFGILDNYIQMTLKSLLSDRNIDNPKTLLRGIKEDRLKSYLGPVLKMLTGHSLMEDDPCLWKKLSTLNTDRNNAIHQSVDISWVKATLSLETVHRVIMYLEALKRASLTENEETVGSKLGISNLPILLQ